MMDAAPTPERLRRRWLRPSMRALMVLIVVIGGLLAWVTHRARVQRLAVAAIERVGGKATHDWKIRVGNYDDETAEPKAPKWLVDLLGPDYFGHVVSVDVGPEDADAIMAHVGRRSRLRILSVDRRAGLTDAGLAHMRGLTENELWERLVVQGSEPGLIAELKAELDRRLAEDDAEPDDVVSWEEVKDQALERIGA